MGDEKKTKISKLERETERGKMRKEMKVEERFNKFWEESM